MENKEHNERKWSSLKCFIGAHQYKVYKEISMLDVRNEECGQILISRCSHCGKIKQTKIIYKQTY